MRQSIHQRQPLLLPLPRQPQQPYHRLIPQHLVPLIEIPWRGRHLKLIHPVDSSLEDCLGVFDSVEAVEDGVDEGVGDDGASPGSFEGLVGT